MTPSSYIPTTATPRFTRQHATAFGGVCAFLLLAIVIYTKLMLFVVPAMGDKPGFTAVMWRNVPELNRIDSADAICTQHLKTVKSGWDDPRIDAMICKGFTTLGTLGANPIIVRFPYSQILHNISKSSRT